MRDKVRVRVALPTSSSFHIHSVSFDRKVVGAIALTVVPYLAHSVASTRVSASVAPFELQ